VEALQQRCLTPEVGLGRRELGADGAAADHRNPLGESLGVALTAAWTCNFSDPSHDPITAPLDALCA
jgi:hypothetical protein